jgi:hypothetical protein
MRKRLPHLALDAIFFLWMIQVFVTGDIVPQALVELFHPQAPIVVVTEPDAGDSLTDPLPET